MKKKMLILFTGQPRLLNEMLPIHVKYYFDFKKIIESDIKFKDLDLEIDYKYTLWSSVDSAPQWSLPHNHVSDRVDENFIKDTIKNFHISHIGKEPIIEIYNNDCVREFLQELTDEMPENFRMAYLHNFTGSVSQFLIRERSVNNIENYDFVIMTRTDVALSGRAVNYCFRNIVESILSPENILVRNKGKHVIEHYFYVTTLHYDSYLTLASGDITFVGDGKAMSLLFLDYQKKLKERFYEIFFGSKLQFPDIGGPHIFLLLHLTGNLGKNLIADVNLEEETKIHTVSVRDNFEGLKGYIVKVIRLSDTVTDNWPKTLKDVNLEEIVAAWDFK